MASELENGQMRFQARLDAIKEVDTQHGKKFIHKFLIPAPDVYNPPTQLYVGSPRRITEVGKDADVTVYIYGWSRRSGQHSFQNHALEEVI